MAIFKHKINNNVKQDQAYTLTKAVLWFNHFFLQTEISTSH